MPQDMTRRQRHQMKGKAMNPTMRCHDSRLLAGLLGGRAMRDLDIRLAGRWIEGFLILLDSCLILFIVRLGSSGLLTLLRSLCHSMTRATRTTWHVLLRPCPPHPHPCQQSHLQRLPYLSRPLLLSRGRLPRLMMVSALARLPPRPSRAIMRRRLERVVTVSALKRSPPRLPAPNRCAPRHSTEAQTQCPARWQTRSQCRAS